MENTEVQEINLEVPEIFSNFESFQNKRHVQKSGDNNIRLDGFRMREKLQFGGCRGICRFYGAD